MNVALRAVTEADRPFLLRLYASTREQELQLVDWTAEQKLAFVTQQFEAQSRHYAEHYEGATQSIILLDGAAAGRLYVARWPREIRIMDIALLPAQRGAGIGTRLLRSLMEEADASDRLLSIHVERFNPARRLYERLGFRDVAEVGVYLRMERPAGNGAPVQENTAS